MERIPKVEGLVDAFHIQEEHHGEEQRTLEVRHNLGMRYQNLEVGVERHNLVEDHILVVEPHKPVVVRLESTDIGSPLEKQELCC
mgnify:CR=1 FL=1